MGLAIAITLLFSVPTLKTTFEAQVGSYLASKATSNTHLQRAGGSMAGVAGGMAGRYAGPKVGALIGSAIAPGVGTIIGSGIGIL